MKKRLLVLFFAVMLAVLSAFPAFANAAEPPCFTVITSGISEDTEIYLEYAGKTQNANVKVVAWETYYRFYSSDFYEIRPDEVVVVAKTENGEFRYTVPEDMLYSYGGFFTFDTEEGFIEGQRPWRIPLLVFTRIAVTLVIEFAVLFLFKIKEKRSILIFFAVNLITQGLLNASITGPSNGYMGIQLYIFEPLIIIAESLVFYYLVPEFGEKHRKQSFAVLYAVIANVISWMAGGWMIAHLPI